MSQGVALERFYSVVVEMAGGQTEVVRVRGANPGEAFRQVKDMPGVRRVGRVSETDPASPAGGNTNPGGRGRQPPHSGSKAGPNAAASSAPAAPGRPASRDELIGHAISGPRVVLHARRGGGEQPFKHLRPPPPRPERPKPPEPVAAKAPAPATPPAATAPPAVVAPQAAAPAQGPADEAAADGTAVPEYRVLKSRRGDGLPYLLQRGSWRQQKGRRVFHVEWEKGFAGREQAEQHRDWVQRTEREMGDADLHAEGQGPGDPSARSVVESV